MTTAPDVLALQETDQALDRARARLTDVEAQMGESEELIAIRQDVAVREEVLTQLRSRLHDAEWSVDDARGKATEVEGKLYGGSIRNPKELTDLNADLSSLKAQVAKREDTLLGLLVEIEEAEALLGSEQTGLAEKEAVWRNRASRSSSSAKATVLRRLPLSWTPARDRKRAASGRCWSLFAYRARRVFYSSQCLI